MVARGNPIFGSVEPWNLATCSKHEALYITQINQSWVLFKQQAFNATVQHVDVCVILPAFCGFMVSGELLQQLGAFRASCRNPKNRIATRSNAYLPFRKPKKSGSAWQSHFWQCGPWNLATCSKHALYITQINQSWVLFKQQAFNATGEDRLWESKFYIPFQAQKSSNKSNSSVTSSCDFLRSRLESQSWNSFNPFPIVNRVSAGVPTPPDSGKTPQLKTSKLAQNCGKTEVLHL